MSWGLCRHEPTGEDTFPEVTADFGKHLDSSWVTHVEVDDHRTSLREREGKGNQAWPVHLPTQAGNADITALLAECDPQAAEEIKAIVIEEARYRAIVNAIPRNKRWSFNNIQQ